MGLGAVGTTGSWVAGASRWWRSAPLWQRGLLGTVVVAHLILLVVPSDVLAAVDPWEVGRRLWRGDVPYRDFLFEYPPLAVVTFLLPGAAPGWLAPSVVALQALACEFAVVWLVLRPVPGAVARWLPLSLLVFPFLAGGIDAFPMAAIAISTAMLARGEGRGWWVASFGTLVKLSPAAAWVWGRQKLGTAAVALLLTVGVGLVPALLAERPEDSYVGYTLERGVQAESVGATTAWLVQKLGGQASNFKYRFRAWELDGASAAGAAWTVVMVVALGALAWGAGRTGRVDPWLASFTAVVVLLVGSKVLSPQFVAWPAPVAALLGGAGSKAGWPSACSPSSPTPSEETRPRSWPWCCCATPFWSTWLPPACGRR